VIDELPELIATLEPMGSQMLRAAERIAE